LDAQYVMQTFKRKPVEFVRGEGMRLYDDAGREYLDFIAGIGVASAGHAHPLVTAALQAQAAKLLNVSNYYYVEGRGELARTLNDLLNSESDSTTVWRTFFTNSGAESVEGAIKLARRYGKKHLGGAVGIVAAQRSFHGRTLAALAATGQPSKQEAFEPLPAGFTHVPLNDLAALQTALSAGEICAVLLEPLQGEGGVWPCATEYLQAVRHLTTERGILLILDEVQTGFYRTGKPFAFQHFGIQPDIITLAKGIANGFPMGALVARDAVAAAFEPGDHGSTFAGGALAVAAANATQQALAELDAAAHVSKVGTYLQQQLAELPLVVEVRGCGLMVGAALSQPVAAQAVDAGLEQGLVLNNTDPATLRFLPPLVCTTTEIDLMIAKLTKILEKLS
jgi:acetylornithine aminotransferase